MATNSKLNKLGKQTLELITSKLDVHSEGDYQVENIHAFSYYTFDLVFDYFISGICVSQVSEILSAYESLNICRAFYTIELVGNKPAIHVAISTK